MDTEDFQTLINSYSRFTDSSIKEIKIFTDKRDKKHCTVELQINGKSENSKIKAKLLSVKKMHIEQIQNFGIYELELKKEGEYHLFNFIPTASDWGELWFVAKSISITTEIN